jgi:signal peptidase I
VRTLFKVLAWVLGIAAVVGGILYALLLDVWTVPIDDQQLAASIEPTVGIGDTILLSRSTNPDVGTLVRCTDPDSPGRHVVARIVAKYGDVVDISGGTFQINGHGVSAPAACDPPTINVRSPVTGQEEELHCSTEEYAGITHPAIRSGIEAHKTVEVEAGRIYLLSDNRSMHLDSRDFGQVPVGTCQRIVFRLWGTGGYNDTHRRFSFIW